MLEERKIDGTNQSLSRRDFLVKAGALGAGMAVAGGILGAAAKAEAAYDGFPYTEKIDLDDVRLRAFKGYADENCCYGAGWALLEILQEKYPTSGWMTIDKNMFKYGGGGVNSWGTLCGALNGAIAIMNQAIGWSDKHTEIKNAINELMQWYNNFPFPTTKLDGVNYIGVKATVGGFDNQVTEIPYSPLCHNSVSRWCKAANATVNSPAKKTRCAKLTGDVTAKAAELLNRILVTDRYKSITKFDKQTDSCMACHAPGNSSYDAAINAANKPSGKLIKDSEQGKMMCGECHGTKDDGTKLHDDVFGSGYDIHDYYSRQNAADKRGADCFDCHTTKKK